MRPSRSRQPKARSSFQLPAGYQIRLLASEPLIAEPSGICWDDKGRCFVCELHGYNVEGQHDIDELNKSGQLDLEVRRIQASEEAKKKAEAETYGTVKLLRDTDGDGVMDKAIVWADRLPPCYGIAAANGGIIVACAPHIVFLKDSDGDDHADVNEKLFTGFGTGNLERGINAPTWGPDGWLYFGRGWAGGEITGPHLAKPVTLPATDFRIRADGSAIEPVSGSTKTLGMAFTDSGERFTCTTTHPGLYVTPIPWRYLTRNPDAAAPVLDSPASDDTRVYPISKPHPWRTKREQHAEYFAFYRKISLSDAAASGYFTSACGPLVWRRQYFVCEPAQNLIHRADIVRDGTRLRLQRVKGEEQREFLASRDAWFHPMSLAHTPEGHMAIVDFYREIIEDYSAIPRHLQQQYGVINGRDRGRVWILEAKEKWQKPPLSTTDAKVLKLRENDDTSGIDLQSRFGASTRPPARFEPRIAKRRARHSRAKIRPPPLDGRRHRQFGPQARKRPPFGPRRRSWPKRTSHGESRRHHRGSWKRPRTHRMPRRGQNRQSARHSPARPRRHQAAREQNRCPRAHNSPPPSKTPLGKSVCPPSSPHETETEPRRRQNAIPGICGACHKSTASVSPSVPISMPSSNAPPKSSCATSSSPAKPRGPVTRPSWPKRIAARPFSASPPPIRPPASRFAPRRCRTHRAAQTRRHPHDPQRFPHAR
jgi:putative membrane-bound dehydrogenase-like protein